MNELLFQPVDQCKGPAGTEESAFEFLERGGREEAIEIRQWMEEWFREFPYERKENLKRRLRSNNYGEFLGALFELQIHRIFRRLDCSVEVEPDFPGTDGTIDFLVINHRQKFYVEATVCGVGKGILHSNSNEQDAVQKIRAKMNSPHSDIWLDAEGELRTTLGTEHVVKPFRDLLDRYTADEVRKIYSMCGQARAVRMLSTEIREGNWVLKGRLEPIGTSHASGKIHGPTRGGAVDVSVQLTKALSDKVKDWKKKQLDNEIFLIAVNICHSDFFWGDEKEAIFGYRKSFEKHQEFTKTLSRANGIITVGNAVLGGERNSPVRVYQNGNKCIPDCLKFLIQEKKLEDLLGIGHDDSYLVQS